MKEEISDLLLPKAIQEFKKGQLLVFQMEDVKTFIVITKLDRKNGRAWGKHIEPINATYAFQHYGHFIDQADDVIERYGCPWCKDCEVPISEGATEEGNVKVHLRNKAKQG